MSISSWSMLGSGSQFNFTQEVILFLYSDTVNHLKNQIPTCGNDQEIHFQSLLLVQPKMLKEAYPKYLKGHNFTLISLQGHTWARETDM